MGTKTVRVVFPPSIQMDIAAWRALATAEIRRRPACCSIIDSFYAYLLNQRTLLGILDDLGHRIPHIYGILSIIICLIAPLDCVSVHIRLPRLLTLPQGRAHRPRHRQPSNVLQLGHFLFKTKS